MSKDFAQIWSENNPLLKQDDLVDTIIEERAKAFKGGEMFQKDRIVAYLQTRMHNKCVAFNFTLGCAHCVYTLQIINFVNGDPTDA